ncbi:hypothetical protein scyTo_0001922 [Scyliorhinus torazame]|uniref:Uncharacterized protein n=1 Tax=Scyliorhinus torazame TaxID=75743 RepID=A0A401PGQ7_SCYTO|nr:hypothetical protein [Scyliorhinus torazame]
MHDLKLAQVKQGVKIPKFRDCLNELLGNGCKTTFMKHHLKFTIIDQVLWEHHKISFQRVKKVYKEELVRIVLPGVLEENELGVFENKPKYGKA